MQIQRVRLQNYRNISFLDLNTEGLTQFFVGANAQGKTNLLEAVGMLSALRSFRTQELNTLIQQGEPEAKLAFNLIDERFGETEVWITLKRKGKEVLIDGEKVSRFRDYIGRFPVVVLSSQDIQFLRGTPNGRRQWLNLVLSSSNPLYFDCLRDYHKLLQERNSLLKAGGELSESPVFEKMLAEKAVKLRTARKAELPRLESLMKAIYNVLSPDEEFPELVYKADADTESVDHFLEILEKNRGRDRILKSTQQGPHRDDVSLGLQSRKARDFASEGQQRSLIVSLKIAQLMYLHEVGGILPVLLADDVLGELDQQRKENFWKAVGGTVQVLATGTQVPESHARTEFQVFDVSSGAFSERS